MADKVRINTELIPLRVSKDTKEKLLTLAKRDETTLVEYVRRVVRRDAEKADEIAVA